jgi:hypothetical protein
MSRKERLFRNAGAPEGLVVFNYKQAGVAPPSADEIPTLVNDKVLAEIMKDEKGIVDPAPYFSIQAIKFPATGSGLEYGSIGNYKKSFFNSFINKTKVSPIPGSKFGHERTTRPSNDFYMIGGKIVQNDGDKESGVAYFKMYIPPRGYTTDNFGLIRDARVGKVQYSLVAKPEFTVKMNAAGIKEYTILDSLGSERNDAVEDGAMDQIVNSSGISLDLEAARALIEAGQFDKQSKIEGDPVQNGCVYRSALRVMLSRANEQDRPALAELVSLIDKSKNSGGKSVDKEEALKLLSNLIKNGSENVQDIIKGLSIDPKLLRNEADEANAEIAKVLNAKLGEKPIEALDAILAENSKAQAAVVAEAVEVIAGPKSLKNAAQEDIVNPAHKYAAKACEGLVGEKLKNAVEELKKDPVLVSLNAQRADGESPLYKVLHNDRQAAQDDSGDGIPTTRIKG